MSELKELTLPTEMLIIPLDIFNGSQCNSAKCPLSRAFNRALERQGIPYYAEVGNYQTHIYDKETRTPHITLIHGENLKAWIRFYDENMPVFPVKVEVRNDARKAHWLAQTVMKVAGDVLSVAPLSETHYLDIPSGEAQAWLLKDLQDDVELPLTVEVGEKAIKTGKRYPMLNPIAAALHVALGQKWQVAVSPDATIIRRKGCRTYSHIFLPNSHKVFMWLTDYNRAGDALPINLVMTKKHIEKEGQNLLHK